MARNVIKRVLGFVADILIFLTVCNLFLVCTNVLMKYDLNPVGGKLLYLAGVILILYKCASTNYFYRPSWAEGK